jgi:hypothetical protein
MQLPPSTTDKLGLLFDFLPFLPPTADFLSLSPTGSAL